MSMTGIGESIGARAARSRAQAVLRIRGRAVAVAILPAAVAVVLVAGDVSGHMRGEGWDTARAVAMVFAVLTGLAALAVAAVIARAEPALSPTVELSEKSAPDLYRLVGDLAERLDVPAPSALALTPDCDSWLEDRTHPAHSPPSARRAGPGIRLRRTDRAPVLVIGSPFLWWMRVAELRALLAPVVAGTASAAQPDIATARRFVRGLDAAVALAARPAPGSRRALAPIRILRFPRRLALGFVGRIARLLLRSCRVHAAEMERGVAAAASERAQSVDYGLRIVAQEQVGLAYAGWDRLLTRVALPAWRMGRWPSRLDAGVVSALTELSRRDRLAEGFASRLGERPACDLLEEPGAVDEATSLLAARLFHGGPAEAGPDWSPVDWRQYPEEVVDRKWRTEAARLHHVLDAAESAAAGSDDDPTLERVLAHLTGPGPEAADRLAAGITAAVAREEAAGTRPGGGPDPADRDQGPDEAGDQGRDQGPAARTAVDAPHGWGADPLPLFPLQPPRTGRDLLADHVTAMVCCAAVDTAGALPGLDWLDGPVLLLHGERCAGLSSGVLALTEDGDPGPLRTWLAATGVRAEKPVRLV
ncbi:hypothetical protein [Streptomyces qinzhouensis]|uniref:Uncharacterized protein n=1 Tax=Streptomyces qinzhouensis TaxID=2599401 RepID=A0A5B8JBB7_9ACTN|nr:hypothetical protein [Streptomyces qinzhouensis]QDY77704.1 hypothetical protein FQU76_15605 [Streptomyces qinzhouensis]